MFTPPPANQEQRLQRQHAALLNHPRYGAMAGIIMVGTTTIDDACPTAHTNGRDVTYGRNFVTSLTDAEFRGLIIHENKHKVYQHLKVWRSLWDKDARTANMACDYVINLEIQDENPDGFCTLPAGGLVDERFRNMSAAQVFSVLWEERETDASNGGTDADGDGGSLDHHDWQGAQDMTEAEQQQLAEDVDNAIRQGALTAGRLGHDVPRSFTEYLQPQVDWRAAMREFITDRCSGSQEQTWARPNRRFLASGMYRPSTYDERIAELCVAIDMSASMDRHVGYLLAEVHAVCQAVRPERVRVLYWDTHIASEEVYDTADLDDILTLTKPTGGGGTDVACVPAHLTANNITPNAVVVLTDGDLWGDWGDWGQNADTLLWCIVNNPGKHPTVGTVTHVEQSN